MAPHVYGISPSQNFQGNDGSWSTFAIQVGTPPATLFVLPATSGRSVLVVYYGTCPAEAQTPTSPCVTNRGQVFDPNRSSTWKNDSAVDSLYYNINFATEAALNPLLPGLLNYTAPAIPGTDDLAFGLDGGSDAPVLKGQLIAVYQTFYPYIGSLGLSALNESVLSTTDTHFSPLGAWKNSGAVSHAYFGYTAGAHYRDRNSVRSLGSLTFGGYDASRGNVEDVLTVPMLQENTDRALTVQVQTMTLGDGSQSRPVDLGIPVLIDSLVPEIWLPANACQAIEDQFGLVWNETVARYLVDDQLNDDLTSRNVSIKFSLAATPGSTDTLEITLPYAALQPQVAWPLLSIDDMDASSRYFPVRKAQNSSQFFLGRTFLQEAYLAADYDESEFYLSQAQFPLASTKEDLRPIGGSTGLSKGAIAGIAVGAVIAFVAFVGLLWFCLRKRKTKVKSRKDRKSVVSSSLGGTTEIDVWNDGVLTEQGEEVLQEEHYKPAMELSSESEVKRVEIDGTSVKPGAQVPGELPGIPTVNRTSEQSSVTFAPGHRHELSAGTIRRISDQSRGSVSPLDEVSRRRHTRGESHTMISPQSGFGSPSNFGQFRTPSPQLSDSQPSPPMSQSFSYFSGPVPMYELNNRARNSPASPSTPLPYAPQEVHEDAEAPQTIQTSGVQMPAQTTEASQATNDPTANRETLERLEGSAPS